MLRSRPNGLVPTWQQDQDVHEDEADHGGPPEPQGTRYQPVRDRDGQPIELRGDHGGEPHTIPAGLLGLSGMRPSQLLTRYRAFLAEPVETWVEDVATDGTVTRRLEARGMHVELASAKMVPMGIREAAVEKLNEHAGEARYLLEGGELVDTHEEAERLALEAADREAVALLGGEEGWRGLLDGAPGGEERVRSDDEARGEQDMTRLLEMAEVVAEPAAEPEDAPESEPEADEPHAASALVSTPQSWAVRVAFFVTERPRLMRLLIRVLPARAIGWFMRRLLAAA